MRPSSTGSEGEVLNVAFMRENGENTNFDCLTKNCSGGPSS